jgi:16S rRNA (cytosine967-C5)-methyltransferase
VIALRLGLYQLRFLSRVPPHAALNEAVNLVRLHERQAAAPLVNAVLRAAQRDAAPLNEALQTVTNPLARAAIAASHPTWLFNRWVERFGEEEAGKLAAANNTAPRVAFRFNPLRAPIEQTRAWLAQNNIVTRPSTIAPNAAVIEAGALSSQAEPVQSGWLYLQDEASQLIANLAAAKIPHSAFRIPHCLDLCAAPGSKTSLLAELLPAETLLIGGDLHWQRLQTMKELTGRLGVVNIQFAQLDALADLPFVTEPGFDLILLDAPCTGLGTLQRHPEIKWRVTEAKIAELAALQKRLLANAARYLRPGGLLTYAVCSSEPEEGEEVIAWFRAQHPAFRDHTRERLSELGLEPATFLTPDFGARAFTQRHGCESFFFCALWKRR